MPTPQLETYQEDETQHIIDDYYGLSTSSHYGKDGSGFGVIRFSLNRDVGSDYSDIGMGYRIILRKYMQTFLFDGDIRQIQEVSGPEGDAIQITGLGQVTKADDDELLRAYCDTRLNRWKVDPEIGTGSYKPDLFSVGASEIGLSISAAPGQEFAVDDYTEVVYEFFDGEVAEKISLVLDSVQSYGSYAPDANPPRFIAKILSISGAVIMYTEPLGEGNLETWEITNASKRAKADISSHAAGSDTITVTDEDDLDGWTPGDVVYIGQYLFWSTLSANAAGAILSFNQPNNCDDTVRYAVGWALRNITQGEWATVDQWNWDGIVAGTITVTVAGDIAGWITNDEIAIYGPFKFDVRDSADVVLWPTDWRVGTSPQTSLDISELTTGSPTGFKLRMTCYVAGATTNDQFWWAAKDLKVYSTESIVTASMLAEEAVDILSVSGHGLSDEVGDIEASTKVLEPMVFEFQSIAQALSWACGYGDGNSNLFAWGIRLTDEKKLFLETQDKATIDYVVRRDGPTTITANGDLQKSLQQVRAIYTDRTGEQKLTGWIYDEGFYFEGKYRRKSIRLSNVDSEEEANELTQLYLDENKEPGRTTRYSVGTGSVFTEAGLQIPIDEIVATGRVSAIEDWRSVETGVSGTDLRDYWTREQIVLVEVNHDAGTATLTPAGQKTAFDAYMAELARIQRN